MICSTINGITEPSILDDCNHLAFHRPCVFINLHLQEDLPAQSMIPCTTAHHTTSFVYRQKFSCFCIVTLLCIPVSRFNHSTVCVYKRNAYSSSTSYLLHFTYHFLSWEWNKILLISPVTNHSCNIHMNRVCILLAISLTNHFT